MHRMGFERHWDVCMTGDMSLEITMVDDTIDFSRY